MELFSECRDEAQCDTSIRSFDDTDGYFNEMFMLFVTILRSTVEN